MPREPAERGRDRSRRSGRRAVGTLLCVCGLAGPASAQQRTEPPAPVAGAEWPELVRRFDAYMAADRVVGGSVALVRDGRIAARHDNGWADVANRRLVDDSTLFHYGSITKTLTAIAIMQLRDRGLLSLDDPVVRRVPELRRLHDPYGRIDSITVRMLLSHSAGFMNPTWPYRDAAWQPFEPTSWDQLVAMMPYQRLHFPPGSRYGYSNPAFIYLARIIEQLTGDPWQSYIQKHLFMPLRLHRSYFGTTPPHLAPHRSHGYDIVIGANGRDSIIDNGAEFDPGITIPNGGWNAPLEDLVRYVAFLTAAPGADIDPERVLARGSLEEMWQPVVAVAPDSAEVMGLSFFLRHTPQQATLVGHTGTQAGFRTFLYFNPANRTGIILAFNTSHERNPGAAALEDLLAQSFSVLRGGVD